MSRESLSAKEFGKLLENMVDDPREAEMIMKFVEHLQNSITDFMEKHKSFETERVNIVSLVLYNLSPATLHLIENLIDFFVVSDKKKEISKKIAERIMLAANILSTSYDNKTVQ